MQRRVSVVFNSPGILRGTTNSKLVDSRCRVVRPIERSRAKPVAIWNSWKFGQLSLLNFLLGSTRRFFATADTRLSYKFRTFQRETTISFLLFSLAIL